MNDTKKIETWLKSCFQCNQSHLNLRSINGGRNNIIKLFDVHPDKTFVVKLYNPQSDKNFDRLQTEWNFLSQANSKNVRFIPKAMYKEETLRACVYSYEAGEKMDVERIDSKVIASAADFIIDINLKLSKKAFSPASDFNPSIEALISSTDKRIQNLKQLDRTLPNAAEAHQFICKNVNESWLSIKNNLIKKVDKKMIQKNNSLFISPSDFGFHNILWHNTTPTFLDFEYSGLDDLSKLANDFFLCPDLQPNVMYRDGFINKLTDALGLGRDFSERCDITLPVHQIKWICIVLKDFIKSGNKQREFASNESLEARTSTQLLKAKNMLPH